MITDKQIEAFAMKIGDSALCDMERLYSEIVKEADVSQITRHLDELAIGWTRRAAYLEKRALGGTHKEAVRAQNNKAKALRRALGYTYPEQDISF